MARKENATVGEAVASRKNQSVNDTDIVTVDSGFCNEVAKLQREARAEMNKPTMFAPVEFVSLNDITPKPIQWLIPDIVPKGMMTVLASDGGVGKTALSLWLASLVSNQGETFNGKPVEHGRVLIWSGEDSPEHVLAPRLRALGADANYVDIIGNSTLKPDGLRAFDIATDLHEVEMSLQNRAGDPPYRLLIIDPIMSVVKGDSNQANNVRQSLEPLRLLAERQNVAVIGITHYSKGTSKTLPQDRVIGSQAFVALARMVLGLGKDEETGNRRLVVLKSNIVDTNIGYEFSYQFFTDEDGCQATRIELLNELQGSARELLAEIEPMEAGSAVAEAVEFLQDILHDRPLHQKEVQQLAKDADISWAAIKRASLKLKVNKSKEKGLRHGQSIWKLRT